MRGARDTRRTTMPTTVPSSVATTSDHGATAAGSGVFSAMIFAAEMPSAMPMHRAERAERRRLDEELAQDVLAAARRATSECRSRACARRRTTSMMFMITMPPTIRLMPGSAAPMIVIVLLIFSKNASADADVSITKLSGMPGRRCRCARSALAHRSPSTSFIIIDARRLHEQPVDVAARIRHAVQRGVERRDRELVERLAEQRALVLDHADDLIRNAADAELAPDGVRGSERSTSRLRRR